MAIKEAPSKAPSVEGFRRKVYERMYTDSISLLKADQEKPKKKIIPTSTKNGLREDFKKTFLPLLIDVFELRQRIQNYKVKRTTSSFFSSDSSSIQPREILKRLQELQKEIEESQRWCEGVILQISKGIEEAKEALQFIEESPEMEECATKGKSAEVQKEKKNPFHLWKFFTRNRKR
jgi:hypothetical protein